MQKTIPIFHPVMKLKRLYTLCFSLLLLILSSCTSMPTTQPDSAPVHHVVLCWLKEAGNSSHRQRLIDTSHSLRDIPGILTIHTGTAIPGDRAIVDDSFDVGIVFTFTDVDAMHAYLVHPKHQAAVQNTLKPLVKKIVVYDF